MTGLAHSYLAAPSRPADYALRRMDLTWTDGGAYALLGDMRVAATIYLTEQRFRERMSPFNGDSHVRSHQSGFH